MLKFVSTLPTRITVGAEEFVLKVARCWPSEPTDHRPWCIVAFSRFGYGRDIVLSSSLTSKNEVDQALHAGFEPVEEPAARTIVEQLLMEHKATCIATG